MVRHSDKFEQNAAVPPNNDPAMNSEINPLKTCPSPPQQQQTEIAVPVSTSLSAYFEDPGHPLSHKRVSLGRIVSVADSKKWDYVLHIATAVVVCFFYIFYFSAKKDLSRHRYLTLVSLLITVITRLYALVHFLMDLPDQSKSAHVAQYLQAWCISFEGTVFIFYWAVLAKDDFSKPQSDVNLSANIFNHLGAFIIAALPLCITRSYFRKLYFLLLILPKCILYMIFMYIWTVPAKQEPIYSVINFKSGMTAVYLLAAGLLGAISFFSFYGIKKCVEKRYRRVIRSLIPSENIPDDSFCKPHRPIPSNLPSSPSWVIPYVKAQ